MVGPVQPWPPHWPHRAEPVPVVGGAVLTVGGGVVTVPDGVDWLNVLITFNRTGCIREAIIASPAAFGWTPSLKSGVGKPVLQSAMRMGVLAVLRLAAHAGMAAFNDWIELP